MPRGEPRIWTVSNTAEEDPAEEQMKKICKLHNNGKGASLPHKVFKREIKIVQIDDSTTERRIYRNNNCIDCGSNKTSKPSVYELKASIVSLETKYTAMSDKYKRLNEKHEALMNYTRSFVTSLAAVFVFDIDNDGNASKRMEASSSCKDSKQSLTQELLESQ